MAGIKKYFLELHSTISSAGIGETEAIFSFTKSSRLYQNKIDNSTLIFSRLYSESEANASYS